MKIAVLGDSHGKVENIDKAMKYLSKVNLIIHTGDHYADLAYIQKKLEVKTIGVRGNCDGQGELEILKEILGKRFFICHGHQYAVKSNLNRLFYRGKELAVDIAIFGHSHMPCYGIEEDLILLNPGSISEPRGGSKKTLVLLEVSEEVKVEFIEIE